MVNWSELKSVLRSTDVNLLSLLPADPQVAPGEEAGHSVPAQMVNPALLAQLGHDGIDEGESCAGLQKIMQMVTKS